MAENRRSYGEGCIAAHALDLIGDRWALLVVRELMLGPKRFGAIKAGLPGIATNMLTRRLEDLEAAGLVLRRALPAPVSAPGYELTQPGLALWPVLRELCRWGAAMPGHDAHLPISPTALMLSMQAMLRADRTPGRRHAAAFSMQGEDFIVTVDDNGIETRPTGRASGPLLFAGGANDMAAAIYGPRPLTETAGRLISFHGDPVLGQEFVDLFVLARPRQQRAA